jgi:hypothetical protein
VAADTKSQLVCRDRRREKWLRATVNEYSYLNNCIVLYTAKDIEGLKGITDDNKAKYEGLLKSFGESTSAIKAAKDQIKKVYELARKLKDALPDSCYSEEVKLIRDCLRNNKANASLDDSVNDILRHAKHVSNQVDDICESTVKPAAINAFINITALDAAGTAVKTKGDSFTGNVKSTIEDLQKKTKEFLEGMTTSIQDFSVSVQDKYKARNTSDAWKKVKEFISKPTPEEWTTQLLHPYVDEAEKSFNDD